MNFPFQQCQDDNINRDFRKLHVNIINQIIEFCVEHNIIVDELTLNADSLEDSIKNGSWQSCTDSSFTLHKFSDEYKDIKSMKKIVSDVEHTRIANEYIPFLTSI